MSHSTASLLRAQLSHVSSSPTVDNLERATLSGLLSRFDENDAMLTSVPRSFVERDLADLLKFADEAVDDIVETNEGEDDDLLWDRLATLDELCAAASWWKQSGAMLGSVGRAVAIVRAFPETWTPIAHLASGLLETAPPLANDPASGLWQAVEASVVGAAVRPVESGGVPGRIRILLGIDNVVSLAAFRPSLRRAAAGALPEPPPWETLVKQDTWSVSATVEDGVVVLVISTDDADSTSDAMTVSWNGQTVALSRSGGAWYCPASNGTWAFQRGGDPITVVLCDLP